MSRPAVIAFRLDNQTAQTLRRVARHEGRLVSFYVRALVEKALAEQGARQ